MDHGADHQGPAKRPPAVRDGAIGGGLILVGAALLFSVTLPIATIIAGGRDQLAYAPSGSRAIQGATVIPALISLAAGVAMFLDTEAFTRVVAIAASSVAALSVAIGVALLTLLGTADGPILKYVARPAVGAAPIVVLASSVVAAVIAAAAWSAARAQRRAAT